MEQLNKKKMFLAYFHPVRTIAVCIGLVIISICVFLVCYSIFDHNSSAYNVFLAITTGVSASAAVTIFAEAMHNRERNLMRIYVLEEYFSIISSYSEGYMTHIKTSEMLEREDGEPEFDVAVWNKAIDELMQHNDVADISGYTLVYVSRMMKDIKTLCRDCDDHIELLSVKEAQLVRRIETNIKHIVSSLSMMLMHDDVENGSGEYPEIEHKKEFKKLNVKGYENEAITHFKKMRLIKSYVPDRFLTEAQEYVIDFLEQPMLIEKNDVSFIAMFLIEIHRDMLQLEGIVSKEPFYGTMIENGKEFTKSSSFDEIFDLEKYKDSAGGEEDGDADG